MTGYGVRERTIVHLLADGPLPLGDLIARVYGLEVPGADAVEVPWSREQQRAVSAAIDRLVRLGDVVSEYDLDVWSPVVRLPRHPLPRRRLPTAAELIALAAQA